jgi:hypothetical protein
VRTEHGVLEERRSKVTLRTRALRALGFFVARERARVLLKEFRLRRPRGDGGAGGAAMASGGSAGSGTWGGAGVTERR